MEPPIYTETYRQYSQVAALAISTSITITLIILILTGLIQEGWTSLAFISGVVPILILSAWTRPTKRVRYFTDRLMADTEKQPRTIFYKDIRKVWKGFFISQGGKRTYAEKFPGGETSPKRYKTVRSSWKRPLARNGTLQEMNQNLTWRAWSWLDQNILDWGTPILFDHTSSPAGIRRLDLIRVQDEHKIVDILKRYSKSTELPNYWK